VLRLIVVKRGVIPASRGGKLKTVVQVVAIGLYVLPLEMLASWLPMVAHVVMAAALVLNLGTGIQYVLKASETTSTTPCPQKDDGLEWTPELRSPQTRQAAPSASSTRCEKGP